MTAIVIADTLATDIPARCLPVFELRCEEIIFRTFRERDNPSHGYVVIQVQSSFATALEGWGVSLWLKDRQVFYAVIRQGNAEGGMVFEQRDNDHPCDINITWHEPLDNQ